MRTRKKYGFTQVWYSICSSHREYNKTCRLCTQGYWSYNWVRKIDSFIFNKFPSFWLWWSNFNFGEVICNRIGHRPAKLVKGTYIKTEQYRCPRCYALLNKDAKNKKTYG